MSMSNSDIASGLGGRSSGDGEGVSGKGEEWESGGEARLASRPSIGDWVESPLADGGEGVLAEDDLFVRRRIVSGFRFGTGDSCKDSLASDDRFLYMNVSVGLWRVKRGGRGKGGKGKDGEAKGNEGMVMDVHDPQSLPHGPHEQCVPRASSVRNGRCAWSSGTRHMRSCSRVVFLSCTGGILQPPRRGL
jgi:hypothetical protein